jgi:hypothetical protein
MFIQKEPILRTSLLYLYRGVFTMQTASQRERTNCIESNKNTEKRSEAGHSGIRVACFPKLLNEFLKKDANGSLAANIKESKLITI